MLSKKQQSQTPRYRLISGAIRSSQTGLAISSMHVLAHTICVSRMRRQMRTPRGRGVQTQCHRDSRVDGRKNTHTHTYTYATAATAPQPHVSLSGQIYGQKLLLEWLRNCRVRLSLPPPVPFVGTVLAHSNQYDTNSENARDQHYADTRRDGWLNG